MKISNRKRLHLSETAKKILYPTLALLLLILVWQAVVSFGVVPSYLLPSPVQVLKALTKYAYLLAVQSFTTLTEALTGLFWGIVVGVLFAVLMDWFDPIKKVLKPLLTLTQAVPTVAIAPLLVLWLGYGMLPKVVLVALTCFFPIAISLLEGFSAVPEEKLELFKTMRATKLQTFLYLKIPSSWTYFFSGLKVGAAYAIVGAVIAEWLGGSFGLGVYMTRVRKSYAYDQMFAVILVIAALSLALVGFVNLAEKICMPWTRPRTTCSFRLKAGRIALGTVAAAAALLCLLAAAGIGPFNSRGFSGEGVSAESGGGGGAGSSGASAKNEAEANVTFVLDYTPNTNHVGIYAALENGYYADAGLNIEIVQPPEDGAEAMVGTGQADFGMSYQDTLANYLFANEPLPITAVAAVLQHNTSGIMSAAELGITRPRDLSGKTYATMQSKTEEAILKNLIEADGGDFSSVTLVPANATDEVSGLKARLFDAIWSFVGWGAQNAAVRNFPVNFMRITDYDPVLDYYTPVIIANDEFFEKNPELAKRFLEATAHGYAFAAEHPKEAVDCLLKAAPETAPTLAYASADYLAPYFISDAPYWGYIDASRWNGFYRWLDEQGLLQNSIASRFGDAPDSDSDAHSSDPATYGFTNKFLDGGEEGGAL